MERRARCWPLFSSASAKWNRKPAANGIAAVKADPAKRAELYKGRQPGSTKADCKEAFRLRKQGNTDDQIAKAIGLARHTVQRYINAS